MMFISSHFNTLIVLFIKVCFPCETFVKEKLADECLLCVREHYDSFLSCFAKILFSWTFLSNQ